MSDSQGVERRGWEDELNAAWALVDVWRGRFEDAAARETALHDQLAGMCDDAAVERGARKLYAEVFVVADMSTYPPGALSWDNAPDYARDEATRCAEAVLRAAGAQQDAAAKPKASGPDA